ncbi:MAG: RHS repeat-associated core domain-containing protein [Mycobacteriales bacterium]
MTVSGLTASPATAAPPRQRLSQVAGADAVISVPRRAVTPQNPPSSGTGLPQAKPARVSWPAAGSARVAIPADGGAARVAATAVSVTLPDGADRARPAAPAAPSRVDVTAYDDRTARQIGGHGTAFQVTSAAGAGRVGVRVDVSGFAGAFGGGFETRLRLLALPACALTTPAAAGCRTSRPVPGHVDLTTRTLVADVPAGTAGSPAAVYVVAAATGGEEGSFTATKLASSSKWSVGLQAGDFSWNFPVPEVPALAGDAPDLDLNYSSQAVDGLTAAENAQPSWVGLGWDLATPFIERRYNGCADDGGDTGDLCWAGDELMLSLQGTSSELVRDHAASGDVWRAKQDPGWRVERHLGADNGDNDGEYWTVDTPQGRRFTFGSGHQPTTGTATDSVFTVPVFGDDAGEPCHQDSVADSWCQQAWRWNLDGLTDAHGNSATYFYQRETNRYARNGDPDKSTDYIRGGHVRDIVYSQRAGAEDVTAPARLHFTTQLRCTEAAGGTGTCPAFDADHASSYPDVPLDQLCTGRCTGDEQKSPTFFTGELLRSVTSQRSDGTGYADVDRVDLTYSFPKPSDGTSASLWLERFQQSGLAGSGQASLPPVEFTGHELDNRVDNNPSAGVPRLPKLRITSVTDELGRTVAVDYTQPDRCSLDNLPEGHADTNTLDCYPAWRTNGQSAGFGWWHKYLVTKVTVTDRSGGSPPEVTSYHYRGQPAWHYDDDDVTPATRKTWSDWRGYGSVDVAQMSDPAYRGEATSRAVSLNRSLFFRGMDGDRLADGGHKSVSVVDSQGTSLADSPWLRNKTRETQQFALDSAGTPTFELGAALHGYTSAHVTPFEEGRTNPDDDAHLVVENSSVNRETVTADPGGDRSTRTTSLATTFDTYGQAVAVTDTAPGDVRCTKTSYARDDTTVNAWMLAFPYRVRTYAGACDSPTSLVTGKDTYYDGSGTVGATVTRGDPTRAVDAVAASGPDTVTQTVTTSATFDAYGRTATETNGNGNGNTARTSYDPPTGRPATVTETNALGQAETTTLDPDRQQPVALRDANGQVTTETYDPLGRLATVRMPEQAAGDPPAKVFSYSLDPDHLRAPLVTTRQLQSGSTYVTTWSFLDSLGRERQSQEVSPAATAGAPKTIVTDLRYDDAGHAAAESLPVVVDGQAGADLLAVPAGSVDETRHSYDALGRETRAAQFGKGRELWATTTAYFGDHTRTTPPAGGVVATSWTDARGRLVRKDQGTGSALTTTGYTYTPADQLATTTDPAQHRSTYAYDLLNRRTSATDPDAGASRTSYDADGNPVASWDAKALAAGGAKPTLSMDYDALDRPTARWAGASGTGVKLATFGYDSASVPNGTGRLASRTTVQDGRSYTEAVLGYDPRGRVTGRSWTFPAGLGGALHPSTYTVRYGYDAADHTTSVSYPDAVVGAPAETITTGYDTLGNPSTVTGTVTDPLTGQTKTVPYISATGYAADGKLASRDYANPLFPLRRAYSYEDDTQRLSRLQTVIQDPLTGNSEAKQDDTYRWDASGNITSITDGTLPKPVSTCFSYDTLDRLAHGWTTEHTDCSDASSTLTHDGPAGFNRSYTYSPDGNVTSSRSLADTDTYTYGDTAHPHAVTRAGGDVFSYDANGAMTKRPGTLPLVPTTLDWDAQHQLTAVTTDVVTKTSFVYAPDGTRMARVDPLGTATLYIDGEEITVALGIASATRFYTEAGVTVAERLPTGLVTWQLNDTQGSAQVALLEGTDLPARTYYAPYGQVRPLSAPPPTDHGFLGKVRDHTTGLDELGARYYDPGLGRFLSPDPAADPSSAQTANAYSYGANNPITYMDPTGLWSLGGAWNAVKNAASSAVDWASEHKGLLTNIAVGIGVGIAVGALCGTGVGCVIAAGVAAGALGSAAGYGVDVASGQTQFSWGGLALNVGIGAASGLLGVGVGKVAGVAAGAIERTAAGQAVKAAVSTGGKAVANTVRAAAGKVAPAAGKLASAAKATAKAVVSRAPRAATKQPIGGGGRVLADAEGATPKEIALSSGGPTGGSRAGQDAVRNRLIAEADESGGDYTCWRCGQTSRNPDNMHVGHRNVPTSEGGNLSPYNTCLEGAACNLSAGNRGAPSPGRSCYERGSCGAPYGRTD